MFGFFTKKKKKKDSLLSPLNAKLINTDIHSHLIAGIDDGATTIDASLELITGLKQMGFQNFWTTPHIMSDFYKNTPEIIQSGMQILNEKLHQKNNAPIHAAAEYYFDENFFHLVEKNEVLLINNEYLLFEFSYINQPENPFGIIKQIKDLGYRPLLAHPERYPYYTENDNYLEELRAHGVYFQVNLNSFAGHYGHEAKDLTLWMIDKNMVDFVGTDIHKKAHLDVISKALCSEYLHRLVESGRLINPTL